MRKLCGCPLMSACIHDKQPGQERRHRSRRPKGQNERVEIREMVYWGRRWLMPLEQGTLLRWTEPPETTQRLAVIHLDAGETVTLAPAEFRPEGAQGQEGEP